MNEDEEFRYSTDPALRRIAVIVNNKRFASNSNLNDRDGAEKDLIRMKKMFKRLGFDVKVYENLKASQMKEKIIKVCQKCSQESTECFACVISTHGAERGDVHKNQTFKEHILFGKDGLFVYTREILQVVAKSKSLKGKPKLFFIQACRGVDFDKGVDVSALKYRTANLGQGTKKIDHTASETAIKGRGTKKIDHTDSETAIIGQGTNKIDHTDSETAIKGQGTNRIEHTDSETATIYQRIVQKDQDDELEKGDGVDEDNLSDTDIENSSEEEEEDEEEETLSSSKTFQTKDEVDVKPKKMTDRVQLPPRPETPPVEYIQIPCFNDMLVMFSSPTGQYAIRNTQLGSYFLYHLYSVMERTVQNHEKGYVKSWPDLSSILTQVSKDLAIEVEAKLSMKDPHGKIKKQQARCVSCVYHCLRKNVMLMPRGEKSKWHHRISRKS